MPIADVRDTIVALASAPGPGRRAIIRISGPDARRVAGTVFDPADALLASRRCRREGQLQVSGIGSPLPADAYLWPAPRSYTGQDVIELHTISCPPLLDRLVGDLLNHGCRSALPGEFTLRAFLAGKLDLTRAEAVLSVIEAGSRQDLKEALTQLAGGITRPLEGLRENLLDLLADVEAGLDFTEEGIQFVDRDALLGRIAKGLAQLTLAQKHLQERAIGNRSFRVVLVGRPNVGKSSLFNALTGGPSALVSAQPWHDARLPGRETADQRRHYRDRGYGRVAGDVVNNRGAGPGSRPRSGRAGGPLAFVSGSGGGDPRRGELAPLPPGDASRKRRRHEMRHGTRARRAAGHERSDRRRSGCAAGVPCRSSPPAWPAGCRPEPEPLPSACRCVPGASSRRALSRALRRASRGARLRAARGSRRAR